MFSSLLNESDYELYFLIGNTSITNRKIVRAPAKDIKYQEVRDINHKQIQAELEAYDDLIIGTFYHH